MTEWQKKTRAGLLPVPNRPPPRFDGIDFAAERQPSISEDTEEPADGGQNITSTNILGNMSNVTGAGPGGARIGDTTTRNNTNNYTKGKNINRNTNSSKSNTSNVVNLQNKLQRTRDQIAAQEEV